MTCIAAAIDQDGTVWMGGDAVSIQNGGCVRIGARAKVFRLGEFVIGATGTLRIGQILEHFFEPPKVTEPLHSYMVREFAKSLRTVIKEHGGEITRDGATEIDGHYIVAVRSQLFLIDPSYSVFSPRAPFLAIGCACQEAMAGMFTARSLVEGLSARRIVEAGLNAAAEFDINIRPPFSILSLAGNEQ